MIMHSRENVFLERINQHNQVEKLYREVYGEDKGVDLWSQRKDLLLNQLEYEHRIAQANK